MNLKTGVNWGWNMAKLHWIDRKMLKPFFDPVGSKPEARTAQRIMVYWNNENLVFPITPKNTNLVEDVEILLPVQFCYFQFSGFRGEAENVSATQKKNK